MEQRTVTSWVSQGWGVKVASAQQLLRLIGHIALLKQGRTYAWRGQSDASWSLSASLYRDLDRRGIKVDEGALRDRENEILRKARRWGLGRDLGSSATDLHLLAVLQHHGVPTRLIDVTSNPMTALWFATEDDRADLYACASRAPGVLFAIDVTNTPWYETFRHDSGGTWDHLENPNPLSATLNKALHESEESLKKSGTGGLFRVFSALPDERMKAQEGYFLGSAMPKKQAAPGVLGINPIGSKPGFEKLRKLLVEGEGPGRPANLPFCAIVIPAKVKERLRDPLKRTYNRRRRVLFPDVDGFREAFLREQLD